MEEGGGGGRVGFRRSKSWQLEVHEISNKQKRAPFSIYIRRLAEHPAGHCKWCRSCFGTESYSADSNLFLRDFIQRESSPQSGERESASKHNSMKFGESRVVLNPPGA